jgi:hypothetical protein
MSMLAPPIMLLMFVMLVAAAKNTLTLAAGTKQSRQADKAGRPAGFALPLLVASLFCCVLLKWMFCKLICLEQSTPVLDICGIDKLKLKGQKPLANVIILFTAVVY